MEPKQDNRVFLFLLLFLLVVGVAGTIAEQITLSAYYPAPMGDYRTVRLVPTPSASMPTCDATIEGLVYYDQTQDKILFCNGTAWSPLGLWTQTGSNIYPNDLSANVGIGTSTPGYDLDITNVAQIQGTYPYLRIFDSNSAVTDDTYSLISNDGQLNIQVSDGTASNFNTARLDRTVQYFPGNVGINTLNPTERLYVTGNIRASGNVQSTSMTVGGITGTYWPRMRHLVTTGPLNVGCNDGKGVPWPWPGIYNVVSNNGGVWPVTVIPIVIWSMEEHCSGNLNNCEWIRQGPAVAYDSSTGWVRGFMCADAIGSIDGQVQLDIYVSP